MPTVKQLQELRAPIGNEIRRMADTLHETTKPDFTAEERARWDKLNKDFDSYTRQIEVARAAENVDTVLGTRSDGRTKPGLEDVLPREMRREQDAEQRNAETELALQAWCRRQHGLDLTEKHKRACKRIGLNPNRASVELALVRRPNMPDAHKRALSATSGTAGAYTIPMSFGMSLEKALKDYAGPREVADVMRTEDGAPMPWPTTNDTDNEGEMIGENVPVAEQDPTFRAVIFGAHKFSSKMVKVPSELLEDSAFNMGTYLGETLGERIGRAQSRKFTHGLGNGEPQGIVTGAKLGKLAANAGLIMADEIIDLIHSVDPAYRRDPSFRLMMHDQILAVIRKLKDGQGRYLFEEGQNGAPDKLKGVSLVINQSMDSTVASGKKTILAGAFKKFKIRDVGVLRLKRLEERYAENDQVGFIGFMRSDSKLLDAGTGPVKYLVHP